MKDILLRTMAGGGAMRIFVAQTKNLVEEARNIHHTSPVVSAALGRLLTGGVMMGAMMKDDTDRITLQINSDGPIEQMIVGADNQGHVKGYVKNPQIDIENKIKGVLPVGEAVGNGSLMVTRDLGLRRPYMGQTPLVSGEIAEDLTYYYAKSEQIPSAVSLGVLVDRDQSIKQAGGFIIQLMPFLDHSHIIDPLENLLEELPSMTEMFEQGLDAQDILEKLANPFGLEGEITSLPLSYKCDCSRERMEKALISLGKEDITKFILEDNGAELRCQFCDGTHYFTKEDLENILDTIEE